MNPSTMSRALSSRPPTSLMTLVSRYVRQSAAKSSASGAIGLRPRHRLDQLVDDGVGRDAFGFGAEVADDAMSEDRVRDGADVLARDVVPAREDRAGLGA